LIKIQYELADFFDIIVTWNFDSHMIAK